MKEASPVSNNTNIKEKVHSMMSLMSLEEKVGQLFFISYPQSNPQENIYKYHIGGYLLFARDFSNKTKEQIINEIQLLQKNSKIPLFLGVDEEGGTVNRISKYTQFRSTPFLSPQELYKSGGFELIIQDTIEKCQLLHELGLNVNFAPVCDISEDPNDFIYLRSFGKDANQTSEYVKTVVTVMTENKIASVLKHFPGYGNNKDTHSEISIDNRSFETFISSDFRPFKAGIDSGSNIVMFSHNVMSCVDDKLPSSLSFRVHEFLRKELNFSGLIITDSLQMNAAKNYGDDAAIAVLAVQAGNDLICCRNADVMMPEILSAVKEGRIKEERINESVQRILEMKISMGLIS